MERVRTSICMRSLLTRQNIDALAGLVWGNSFHKVDRSTAETASLHACGSASLHSVPVVIALRWGSALAAHHVPIRTPAAYD